MTSDEGFLIEAIEKQLISLSVGTCSCHTKAPNPHFHDVGCHYRIAIEALENVESLKLLLEQYEAAP